MNIFSTGNERQLTADYGMYLTLTADVERKHLPLVKIVHLKSTKKRPSSSARRRATPPPPSTWPSITSR